MTDRSAQKEQEIEVTPEMVEAGLVRLRELASEFPEDYVVEKVYLAMLACSPTLVDEGRSSLER